MMAQLITTANFYNKQGVMTAQTKNNDTPLIDPFGRVVDYVRLSVTDRCDFRCVYCMAEEMTFLPKSD